MKNERIKLLTVTREETDTDGFSDKDMDAIEVFAQIKSVKGSEYYEALKSGIQASILFVVNPDDFLLTQMKIPWNGSQRTVRASKVEYEGITYRIKRTYRLNSFDLELTCEVVE